MFFFLTESQADRSIGEKKPKLSGEEGPSLTELSGFNFKRQEFEIEYDNDAEQLLADMEFKDADTDAERELKLRVLRIYSKRYTWSYTNIQTFDARNYIDNTGKTIYTFVRFRNRENIHLYNLAHR